MSTAVTAAKAKKRKRVSLDSKKARAGWFFCLPFILGFLLIYLPIIVDSVSYSFSHEFRQGKELVQEFVGFANYREALTDVTFLETLGAGIGSLFMDIPAIVIFSLFVVFQLFNAFNRYPCFCCCFFLCPQEINLGYGFANVYYRWAVKSDANFYFNKNLYI